MYKIDVLLQILNTVMGTSGVHVFNHHIQIAAKMRCFVWYTLLLLFSNDIQLYTCILFHVKDVHFTKVLSGFSKVLFRALLLGPRIIVGCEN